ncbi:6-methylsalicylic acid decarboxylase atA [Vanrija pseudolonga]|uniref:6-methylsalicylic acid decarboxylase atA n=1 Tax=Vanrija pseudolonga TaxID=143232 RepID=A0AAF1BHB9_9TREE|nr:6-methylsalicylic acid decarboxylase atA [Vanrija pseudolonga]
MPTSVKPKETLRVAISGGGPAGLAAAIALREVPGVDVTIYEQATELREVGAGIRIGFNSWKVLELLGVEDKVYGHKKVVHEHRDGTTGELQYRYPAHYGPDKYHDIRARRTVLQAALLSKVPTEVIQLRKRLITTKQLPGGQVRLNFEDGTSADADLLIGADGIRSAVRDSAFPGHEIRFNGTTIWRCLIPLDLVKHSVLLKSTAFHHGPNTNLKCSIVSTAEEIAAGEGQWEMTLRYREDPAKVTEKKFSWGVPVSNERVASHFTAFTPAIQEAISLAPEGVWKEFAAFSGPRLEHIIANGNTTIIGDASHPLLGAFGSGAAFAMQDGWLLAQILRYYLLDQVLPKQDALAQTLELFDNIRSPYYHRMYDYLDSPNAEGSAKGSTLTADPKAPLYWIFGSDIGAQWEEIRAGLP